MTSNFQLTFSVNIDMSEITLQELCSYLNQLLSIHDFADYCPNGLQVEGKGKIKKIATAVSVSLETIQQAIHENVDALIVHHGLFWKGDDYPIVGLKKEKIELLLRNGISLLGYHLPLDAHELYGNNWKAANDLGWEDLHPCGFMNGVAIGVMGRFPEMSREMFQSQLEEYYQHKAHVALGGKETVASAYLISGGAYKSLKDAANSDVDCFITGNFDEPAWREAFENKINFFACGHSATERVGPMAIGKHLSNTFDVEHVFLDVYNPF